MTGWNEVGPGTPKKTHLLVARPSGYLGIDWEYLTAEWDPTYKGWVDVGNCRLTDSGVDPQFWTHLPDPPPKPPVGPGDKRCSHLVLKLYAGTYACDDCGAFIVPIKEEP